MHYLIRRKCKEYYKLLKGEVTEDFQEYINSENLKYDDYPNKGVIYVENEPKNTERNSKLFSISFFNFKVLYVITLIVMLSISYLFSLINLIMDYSLLISLILSLILVFRYILGEINTKNLILKFVVDRTTFLIIPLLIIFISIVIYSAMTV